jgi:hypothetical protein
VYVVVVEQWGGVEADRRVFVAEGGGAIRGGRRMKRSAGV